MRRDLLAQVPLDNPTRVIDLGSFGGRKSHAERWPEIVTLAKRLRRASPKSGERLSFREISVRLAAAGHRNERGQPFNPQSVQTVAWTREDLSTKSKTGVATIQQFARRC